MPASDEAKYLDNLLAAMSNNVDRINLRGYDTENPDRLNFEGWLALVLQTLVAYAVVAEVIGEYAPSKDSQKRVRKAYKQLRKGQKKTQHLAAIYDIDMARVVALGEFAMQALMPNLTEEGFYLQYEYGHKGHAAFRRKAALAVLGRTEADSINAKFWTIVLEP